MTQQKVPFSIELWHQGWRPVDEDGNPLEGFIPREPTDYFCGSIPSKRGNGLRTLLDTDRVFLLPPEDDIVVEVKDGIIHVNNQDLFRIPPGRYKLVKID